MEYGPELVSIIWDLVKVRRRLLALKMDYSMMADMKVKFMQEMKISTFNKLTTMYWLNNMSWYETWGIKWKNMENAEDSDAMTDSTDEEPDVLNEFGQL